MVWLHFMCLVYRLLRLIVSDASSTSLAGNAPLTETLSFACHGCHVLTRVEKYGRSTSGNLSVVELNPGRTCLEKFSPFADSESFLTVGAFLNLLASSQNHVPQVFMQSSLLTREVRPAKCETNLHRRLAFVLDLQQGAAESRQQFNHSVSLWWRGGQQAAEL